MCVFVRATKLVKIQTIDTCAACLCVFQLTSLCRSWNNTEIINIVNIQLSSMPVPYKFVKTKVSRIT